MKKILLILLLLVVLISSVSAQNTYKQTQPLDIKVPCFDSDKNFCDSSTNCTLTVDRPDGMNIVDGQRMTHNPSFFNYTINRNLLNQTGIYPSTVHCNISGEFDYDRFTFEITASGKNADSTGTAGIAIVIFILFIVIFLLYIGFRGHLVQDEIANLILRRVCFLLAIYLMILNSTMVATIAGAANLDLTNELFTYMTIFGYAGYIALIYIMFRTIVDYLGLWRGKKEKEKYGDMD